jgi:cytochrome oxidase Cu insertion factor (SCO1/SenC/PrrC family)
MSGINSSAPASPDSALLVNLSVHSLPSTRDAAELRRTERGRWTMGLVLLVCAAPVIASYLAYFSSLRPQARTNYSELIVPTRPIPASLPLADLAGTTVAPATLRGQWLIVVVAGGACDARCERHLWLQRQLHAALGANQDRVDKVWLVDDKAPPRPETLRAIAATADTRQTAFAPTTVLRTSRAALLGWLAPAPGNELEDHLYLVDPHGEWMMRVPVAADPGRLKRDLDKLLSASAGWDRPGR